MMNPATVPARPRKHVLARAEGVGTQDRQRAEHDPERVLYACEVGDEDGEAEAGRSTDSVVQRDRVPLEVGDGALLCGGEGVREALRLVTGQTLQKAPSIRGGGEVDVGGDLQDGEAQLLGAKTRGRAR